MPFTSVLSQPRTPAYAQAAAGSADSLWAASVRIRLQDYEGDDRSAASEAEARYRKLLERAFGGPEALSLALRAYSQACEGDPDEIDAEQKSMAEAWVKASHRAHADSLGGLDDAQSAWFEVSAVKTAPFVEAPAAPEPEPEPEPEYEPPIPMDEVFVAAPASAPVVSLAPSRALAACSQAPARTRVRSSARQGEEEAVAVAQISLF